jgi:hypothetical protein
VRSPAEILDLFLTRQKDWAPAHQGMETVRAVYDGDAKIDLPDVDRTTAASVPNLLAQGVDQMAARIASVAPMVTFASDKPGQRTADRRADTCQRVVTGWWQDDHLPLKMKYRARNLIAYGMAPVTMRYSREAQRPTWEVRDPLTTYTAPERIPGTNKPVDCIFAYRRSIGWLVANGYKGQVNTVIGGMIRRDWPADTQMTVLEYVDPDCRLTILTGHAQFATDLPYQVSPGTRQTALLEACILPRPCMTALVPQRISLSRMAGQFNAMLGMYYQQAKLEALTIIAVEKGIFPDTYLESRPGEVAKFLDGPHDGRTGKVNVVQGGVVREIANNPGYQTNTAIDRLERAQRLTSGIPSEFGGESGSNIRTGRRGDAVLSAVIDFPVAEAQEVFAYSLEEENEAAIELAKMYDEGQSRTIYVGTGNAARSVNYVADDVFTHNEHTVAYPAVGTDLNSLMIGLGQRVGMGIMSKETAAHLDPFISAPELEHDRIITEGLEQALMSGLQQQAASGAIPPLLISKLMSLVGGDKMELPEAMNQIMEDAKAQAAQDQAAQQQASASDQALAGSAPPALGGPIPGPSQGQTDLATLMTRLRQPARTIVPMRGTQQGAV